MVPTSTSTDPGLMTPARNEHLVDGVLLAAGSAGLRMECQTCTAIEIVLLEETAFDAVVARFFREQPTV